MRITDIERELRDHPGDLASWLEYGDRLLERGDTRGTLIRLEQRRDRLRSADRDAVQQEIDQLVADHRRDWDAALPEGATVLARRYGFATKVAVEWSDDAPVLIEQVLREPFVTALRVTPPAADEDEDEDVWDEEPEEGDAPDPSPSVDTGALATLDLGRLTELDLSYLRIGALGAKTLAASAYFRMGASDGGALAAPTTTGRLETLDLRYGSIGNDGLAALATSPGFAGVRRLRLQKNALTAKGMNALHRFAGLAELDLRYNAIGEEGADALLAAPFIGSLRRLLLYRADVTDAGAKLLASAPQLPPALRSYWRSV